MPNRILIADDNEAERRSMEGELGNTVCELEIACDGNEAPRKAASFRPHLIILDGELPGLSSLEVCRRLKTKELFPIVFLISRVNDSNFVAQAVEAGVDDFLSKPLNWHEFVRRIENLLKLSAA